jgi:hypothetical protein
MMKTVSFDKLGWSSPGNYCLERFIGHNKVGPTLLACTDAMTSYLLRLPEGNWNCLFKEESDAWFDLCDLGKVFD